MEREQNEAKKEVATTPNPTQRMTTPKHDDPLTVEEADHLIETLCKDPMVRSQVCDYDNLAKLIETYTLMAMNAVGVAGEEAQRQARVVAGCVIGDLEAEHP